MKKTHFKTLFLIGVILILLGPLALLLRTQQPWNCFQLTYDENVFIQAIYNWAHGAGFRLHGEPMPFDPKITVGIPLAWGSNWVHRWSGEDWPQASRLWVFLNFVALLILIARDAVRRYRLWSAGLIAVSVFTWFVSKILAGPYLVYGILGEIPGAVFAWLSLTSLQRGRCFLGGLFAAAAYFTKPTFIVWIPAAALGSWIRWGRRGLLTSVAAGLGLLAAFLFIAASRDQSLFAYLNDFTQSARGIAMANGSNSLLNYYKSAGIWAWIFSALALLSIFGKKPRGAGDLAAWLLLSCGIAYYLFKGARPLDKHWFVFLHLAVAVGSVRLGGLVGPILARLFTDDRVALVSTAIILTWAINVPGMIRKGFHRSLPTACAVKEQREIDRALVRALPQQSDVSYVQESGAAHFLYELGWNPQPVESWDRLRRIRNDFPRWITGDLPTLLPLPEGCEMRFLGSLYGLAECKNSGKKN